MANLRRCQSFHEREIAICRNAANVIAFNDFYLHDQRFGPPFYREMPMTLAQALRHSHHRLGFSSPDLRAYQHVTDARLARIFVTYNKHEAALLVSHGVWDDEYAYTQPDDPVRFARIPGVLDAIETYCKLLAEKYPYSYNPGGWTGW